MFSHYGIFFFVQAVGKPRETKCAFAEWHELEMDLQSTKASKSRTLGKSRTPRSRKATVPEISMVTANTLESCEHEAAVPKCINLRANEQCEITTA